MVMLFADSEANLNTHAEALKKTFSANGLDLAKVLDGHMLKDNKEHFGFRDGISQPLIEGSGILGPKENTVATGEFIMGYKNEYNVYPQSPFIHKEQGDMNILAADSEGSGHKDLGKNGSYLVFRQMEQHMDKFWNFVNDNGKNADGSVNEEESLKIASKMVGRWPSGAPLVKFPDKDPGVLSNDNDLSYATDDKEGIKCPFGSHLRRLNPRDSFEDNGPKRSIKLSNRHRIIRRARHFGSKEFSTPTQHENNTPSGLHFMCFNADISRQFEFIQYSWANNPRVSELYDDPDPLIGVTNSPNNTHRHQNKNNVFTIPEKPVNRRIKGLQRFVTIKGGAYFFYPSIAAIKYISSL
jgi:Dyp-type peroxidase family